MERRSIVRAATVTVAVLALGMAGCKSTPEKTPETAGSGTGSEFDDGTPSRSEQTMPAAGLETVYFDYDRYDIRSDAKTMLRQNADSILQNSAWGTVTIEGHCDERGSEEYNLALGERRATGVKRYLVDLGVPSSRIATVSFGEAKPSVMGHDESAWRYNRRSEFTPSR